MYDDIYKQVTTIRDLLEKDCKQEETSYKPVVIPTFRSRQRRNMGRKLSERDGQGRKSGQLGVYDVVEAKRCKCFKKKWTTVKYC